MTNEEKQLLLKVLCAMLPYGIIIHIEGAIGGNYLNGDSKLTGIHNGIIHVENQPAYGNYEGFPLTIETKPYLRPMDSMTEEEKKELNSYSSDAYWDSCEKKVDWLNEHYFDYRGLIEKGLALEAPEGMYKTKYLRIRRQEEERKRVKQETMDRIEWLAEMDRDRRKMKDYNNCNIQFRFEDCRDPEDARQIWWRIQPSELSFWDRLFHNPWRTLTRHLYGDMNPYFTPMDWKEELSHLKTYADVIRYQRDEYHKYKNYTQKKIELGEYWPR